MFGNIDMQIKKLSERQNNKNLNSLIILAMICCFVENILSEAAPASNTTTTINSSTTPASENVVSVSPEEKTTSDQSSQNIAQENPNLSSSQQETPPAIMVLADMTNLSFTPLKIECSAIPGSDLTLMVGDSDLASTFTNRGISCSNNQIAFGPESEEVFYLIPANNSGEFYLVTKYTNPNGDMQYAFVVFDTASNRFVASQNAVSHSASGFTNPPPSDNLATFQVFQMGKHFYLKKGNNFLSKDDQAENTGFLVLDKLSNGIGLFVDRDVESTLYKGFSSSYDKAQFKITNLADINLFNQGLPDQKTLDRSMVNNLVKHIAYSIDLAVKEDQRVFLNQIIIELGKYFLKDQKLNETFAPLAEEFFAIKEAQDSKPLLEKIFNNLEGDYSTGERWNIELTTIEQQIITLLRNALIDNPRTILEAARSAAEIAARTQSLQNRIQNVVTFSDMITLVKEFSNAEKWFITNANTPDIMPDENKIKTSSDLLLSNIPMLFAKIDTALTSTKTSANEPNGSISDSTASDITELKNKLGNFISVTCWQTLITTGYLAVDVIGQADKMVPLVTMATSAETMDLNALTTLSINRPVLRVFNDKAVLSRIKEIFYTACKLYQSANDIITTYKNKIAAAAAALNKQKKSSLFRTTTPAVNSPMIKQQPINSINNVVVA